MKTQKKEIFSISIMFIDGYYCVTVWRKAKRKNAKTVTNDYKFRGDNTCLSNRFFDLASNHEHFSIYSHFNRFPTTNIYTSWRYEELREERKKQHNTQQ